MRSHMAPSWLVWKLTTSAPSSRPRSCSWPSICSSVMVPYCLGSRLPNMLWLMPCSMRIFIACLSVLLESGGDQGTSKKFDRVAAGGRAGDGFGHPQVGQAVARTHQRGRFATHHSPEMRHLLHDRIVAHQAHHTHLERLPPGGLAGAGVGFEPHRRNRQAALGAGDDVTVLVIVTWIGLVFLRGLLPAARAGRGVRQHEAAQHAIGKAQVDAR